MSAATMVPSISSRLPVPNVAGRQNRVQSPDAARVQLSKILDSSGFTRAPRMRRFLAFVVEEALNGRARQLCEHSIAASVFDRDQTFEPGLDPIVRNDARRLRQKLLEYYQASDRDEGDEIVIEIPKGSYAPIFRSLSHRKSSGSEPQYRLVVTLIRIADDAEIWSTHHEY